MSVSQARSIIESASVLSRVKVPLAALAAARPTRLPRARLRLMERTKLSAAPARGKGGL